MGKTTDNWYVMGLVDDVLRRHALPEFNLDKSPLHTLLKATLLGRRLLVHESTYCIQKPFISDLLKGDQSFVKTLAKKNQLRLLTGKGDLWDWIEVGKTRGIYNPEKHRFAGEALDEINSNPIAVKTYSRELQEIGGYTGLPSIDHSWALEKAILGSAKISGTSNLRTDSLDFVKRHPSLHIQKIEWQKILKNFEGLMREREKNMSIVDKLRYYPAARTAFEDAVEIVFGRGNSNPKSSIAMAVANEHYHNSLAALLTNELSTPIGSITCFTGAFRNFQAPDDPDPRLSRRNPTLVENEASILINPDKIISAFSEIADDFYDSSTPLGSARNKVCEILAIDFLTEKDHIRLVRACIDYEMELAYKADYPPPRELNGQVVPSNENSSKLRDLVEIALNFTAFIAGHKVGNLIEKRIFHLDEENPITRRNFLRVLALGAVGASEMLIDKVCGPLIGSEVTGISKRGYLDVEPRLFDRFEFSALPIDVGYARVLSENGKVRQIPDRFPPGL